MREMFVLPTQCKISALSTHRHTLVLGKKMGRRLVVLPATGGGSAWEPSAPPLPDPWTARLWSQCARKLSHAVNLVPCHGFFRVIRRSEKYMKILDWLMKKIPIGEPGF